MDAKVCLLCGEIHDFQSGFFSRHLKKVHDITLEEYIIATIYDGISPRCGCGLCEEKPIFRRGKFTEFAKGHENYEYRKQKYIEKYGQPICSTCGKPIEKWGRGMPNKYCSKKCFPGAWNQETIKKTIKERYGVDNVFQIPKIIETIHSKLNYSEMSKKAAQTRKARGDLFINDSYRETCRRNNGVDHPFKIESFRKETSERMILHNPMKNLETVDKKSKTFCERVQSGQIKLFKTLQYKDTNLYYQSSFEKDFLELCESLSILHEMTNGHVFEYVDIPGRCITDFSINDTEIEIKSSYILEKQGGYEIIERKQNAVQSIGKNYLLILDKNYEEFLEKWKRKNI